MQYFASYGQFSEKIKSPFQNQSENPLGLFLHETRSINVLRKILSVYLGAVICFRSCLVFSENFTFCKF